MRLAKMWLFEMQFRASGVDMPYGYINELHSF